MVAVSCGTLSPWAAAIAYDAPVRETLIELALETPLTSMETQVIRQALRILPPAHYQSLRQLEVRDEPTMQPRGRANSSTIILNNTDIASEDELFSVLLHELGHILDLGYLTGSSGEITAFAYGSQPVRSDDPSYDYYRISWAGNTTQLPTARPADFVSGYAASMTFEDFAESYHMYITHQGRFVSLAAQNPALAAKYTFLRDRVFDGYQYADASTGPYPDAVYDTTLLSLDWKRFIQRQQSLPTERALTAVPLHITMSEDDDNPSV